MKDIKILDCTLRDGGYVNDWEFGQKSINNVLSKLALANVDIIECGFLKLGVYNKDKSLFPTLEAAEALISEKNATYVCMINFGEYPLENIPVCTGDSKINGIRVVFHYKERWDALAYCEQLKKKGYKLFIQPMAIMNYKDEEIIEVVKKVNDIQPYAFYVVDSFGVMRKKDFTRIIYLVDHNLKDGIVLGYHSHNNLQLAFSNAQLMLDFNLNREIILDSTTFGMGRGAGNLNTELIADYLNQNYNKNYLLTPLLELIDECLSPIYAQNFWGYSLAHYLSAINNCHPNYATWLSEKNTLTIKSINEILSSMTDQEKSNFKKQRIEELYERYQVNYIDDTDFKKNLENCISRKKILLLAAGNNLKVYRNKVLDFVAKEDVYCISVNFVPEDIPVQSIFCANRKRLKQVKSTRTNIPLIITSNIQIEDSEKEIAKVNYSSLLCKDPFISDNSMLMLINLLVSLGVKEIYTAGFDGYGLNIEESYYDKTLQLNDSVKNRSLRNERIKMYLSNLKSLVTIHFLTPTYYS
ncbi:MAG: aldolase catalytic domain-containing protein [[Clostridium] symbiosum]